MPVYSYRCKNCGTEFTETHAMTAPAPDCPECESEDVQRLITDAPTIAGGLLTHAGDGKNATKEELKAKWQEETPKLAKKLRDKLGPGAVENLPSFKDVDLDD